MEDEVIAEYTGREKTYWLPFFGYLAIDVVFALAMYVFISLKASILVVVLCAVFLLAFLAAFALVAVRLLRSERRYSCIRVTEDYIEYRYSTIDIFELAGLKKAVKIPRQSIAAVNYSASGNYLTLKLADNSQESIELGFIDKDDYSELKQVLETYI